MKIKICARYAAYRVPPSPARPAPKILKPESPCKAVLFRAQKEARAVARREKAQALTLTSFRVAERLMNDLLCARSAPYADDIVPLKGMKCCFLGALKVCRLSEAAEECCFE